MTSSSTSFIQKAFPVPRALYLSHASLDISDGIVRFFEFSRSQGQLIPKAFAAGSLPRIHISSADESLRKEAVKALTAFADEHHINTVDALIHEGEVYVFKTKVPTTNESEIHAAIEGSLEENVPVHPNEALFEYDILSVDCVRNETTVAVSVVSDKTINAYVDLLQAGTVVPVSFDTEARSAARALFAKGESGVHVVLCIKQNHSVVFIVEQGKVAFSSSIEIGSSDIDKALAKTFTTSTDIFSDDPKIFEALAPVISAIRDEVHKVIVYFDSQEKKQGGTATVSSIVLAGSYAAIPGILPYFAGSVKLPARLGSVWTNVLSPEKTLPRLTMRESLDYASSIGILI